MSMTRYEFATLADVIKDYLKSDGLDELTAGMFAANAVEKMRPKIEEMFDSHEKAAVEAIKKKGKKDVTPEVS